MSDLRAAVVEAGAQAMLREFPKLDQKASPTRQMTVAALDAFLDTLADRAIPLYDAGGIAPAYYIDDEPDENTIWVIDLAVLRGDTQPEEDS